MTSNNDTREAITIDPAEDGGYVVMTTAVQGYRMQIKFAGSLTQCLEYIQKHFDPAVAAREAHKKFVGEMRSMGLCW